MEVNEKKSFVLKFYKGMPLNLLNKLNCIDAIEKYEVNKLNCI